MGIELSKVLIGRMMINKGNKEDNQSINLSGIDDRVGEMTLLEGQLECFHSTILTSCSNGSVVDPSHSIDSSLMGLCNE